MHPSRPLLTIAMPVFERTDFFLEALQSAIQQTVAVPIVVVDNASSHDRFECIVAELGDARVSYVRNDRNLGMYGNWNRCAEVSESEFVMILGDDDVMDPGYVAAFMEARSRHPEISAYFCKLHWFGDTHVGAQPQWKTPLGLVHGETLLRSAVDAGLNVPTNSMTIRRDLLLRVPFLYPAYALNQDWLFAYTAFANEWLYSDERIFVSYRVHGKGNALQVGRRAYLSTALVYREISRTFNSLGDQSYALRASTIGRWIPRNVAIAGDYRLILEMIEQRGNPFGEHLKELVDQDPLLRLALRESPAGQSGRKLLHGMRFLQRLTGR